MIITNDGYIDPYPQKGIDRAKIKKKGCSYHFLHANGDEKVFGSLMDSAAFYGVTHAAVHGWLKRKRNLERQIMKVWRAVE